MCVTWEQYTLSRDFTVNGAIQHGTNISKSEIWSVFPGTVTYMAHKCNVKCAVRMLLAIMQPLARAQLAG